MITGLSAVEDFCSQLSLLLMMLEDEFTLKESAEDSAEDPAEDV